MALSHLLRQCTMRCDMKGYLVAKFWLVFVSSLTLTPVLYRFSASKGGVK